jgi:DNA polymerase
MIDDADRKAIRDRLDWLRWMGVEELRVAGEQRAAPPPETLPATGTSAAEDTSGRASRGSLQQALFGESVAPVPAGTARRGTAGDRSSASPLAGPPRPEGISPNEALAAIREDIGDCRRCRLSEKRTRIVFGVGSPRARLMFIGEGPGADEDLQGEPFVGRAGQLLTKIIESMGLTRQEVYIANVVKCRPPENRTPLPDEVGTCSPFLFRQIQAIRPRVIVCLGTPAAQAVLGTRDAITRIRGVVREVEGFRIMPTFHPAYLLRNPAAKREVWADMKQVLALLAAE